MAQLTGNQIKNTYQGLLKTEDNGALGAGVTQFTDGLGNQTGMAVDKLTKDFRFIETNQVNISAENDAFTKANYPMGSTAGQFSAFNFKDSAAQDVAYIAMDRYGSIEYKNIYGDQGETHYFTSQKGDGSFTPAKIAIDSWNGPNNSSNWYLGFQRSLSAGSYSQATGNLTLSRSGTTPIVVSVPGTTYDLASIQTGADVAVNLVGSNTTTDTVTLIAGSNITLTDDGSNNITIDAAGGGGGGASSAFAVRPNINFGGAMASSMYTSWPIVGDMSGAVGAAIDQGDGVGFIARFLPTPNVPITKWVLPIFNNTAFTGNHTMEVAVYDMYPNSYAPRTKVHSDTIVMSLSGSNERYEYTLPTSFTPTSDAYWIAIQSDTSDTDGVYIGVAAGFSSILMTNVVGYGSDPSQGTRGRNILRYGNGALPTTLSETQEYGSREEMMYIGYKVD